MGTERGSRGWWEEYGYDYENQVGHLEIAAVAPTQVDANTVYFNMRNLPGWDFAIENDIEPAMFMGLYRATATGQWPNQTWTMDPVPVYHSDGFTWELGGPRAVDAQVWDDLDGKRYVTFGSWDPADRNVIVTAELDRATGRLAGVPADESGYYAGNESLFHTIATYGEAATIFQRGPNDYHLFLNVEGCCSGVDSKYTIVTGRSASPLGPFVDRQGRRFDQVWPAAAEGQPHLERFAGELLLEGEGRYIGPGHAGVYTGPDGQLQMSFHYYDGLDAGKPKLGVRELLFDEAGWPKLAPTPDFDRDGAVGATDYELWRTRFGQAGRNTADGNGDGRVNLADYTLWRDALDTTAATYSGADGSGDGAVSIEDDRIWVDYFGTVEASAGQLVAPEPSTAILLVAGSASLTLGFRASTDRS